MKQTHNQISYDYLYVLRPDITDLPPVMSQLEVLSKKKRVKLICYFLSESSKQWLNQRGIDYKYFGKENIHTSNKIKKIIRYLKYKNWLKFFLKQSNYDKLWVGSLESLIAIGKSVLKKEFILNVYEIPETRGIKGYLSNKYGKKAKTIIVPEYNRSHIIRYMWKLKKTPIVIENKPLYLPNNDHVIKNTLLDKYISDGYKIILYQGIFHPERDLKPLAKSLQIINEKYLFLLMTPFNKKEIDKIKDIYQHTLHIGFIPAPNHLSVTKIAHIGIATYDHSSLNTIFCAPNKIYEYAMMGLPILGNDIPGLKYTIERTNSGKCVDMFDTESIINGIRHIMHNYEEYRCNLGKLLLLSDPIKEIEKIINEND